MKDIEKKLHAVAHNGNLASPLLLEDIKAKIAADPLKKEDIRSAKVRSGFRFSFGAVASALTVFVVCYISVLLGLIFIMPAGYATPPDGYNPDFGTPLSLEAMTEIYVSDYTPREYSQKHSLGLLCPDGDGKLYRIEEPYANDNPYNNPSGTGIPEIFTVAYKSVYTSGDLTLTIVQTTHTSIRFEEYENYATVENKYATYTFSFDDGDYISFKVFTTDEGMLAVSYLNDSTAYLTVNSKEPHDLLWYIYQIVDNVQAERLDAQGK